MRFLQQLRCVFGHKWRPSEDNVGMVRRKRCGYEKPEGPGGLRTARGDAWSKTDPISRL
jgi:hypothetical protein